MKRRITYLPLALQDLDDSAAYSRRTWGEAKARAYVKQLTIDVRALEKVALRHPLFEGVQLGMRRRPSQHHFIFYLVHPDRIEIVRILHKQMDHGARLG